MSIAAITYISWITNRIRQIHISIITFLWITLIVCPFIYIWFVKFWSVFRVFIRIGAKLVLSLKSFKNKSLNTQGDYKLHSNLLEDDYIAKNMKKVHKNIGHKTVHLWDLPHKHFAVLSASFVKLNCTKIFVLPYGVWCKKLGNCNTPLFHLVFKKNAVKHETFLSESTLVLGLE